jgi:hypothetical protein
VQTEMESYLGGRFSELSNYLNVRYKEKEIIKDNFKVSILENWVDVV